jgi:hypothetical protein
MTGLNSLADITLRDILGNFLFHTNPPKVLFEILVYLSTTRVHGKFGHMGLVQNLFTELMVLGYNDTFVEP